MKHHSPIALALLFNLLLAACGDNTNTGSAETSDVITTSADADASSDLLEEVHEPETVEDVLPEVTGPDHECLADDECIPKVPCARGVCVPATDGNRCIFFAKLEPENFCDDEDPCTIDTCNVEPKTQTDYENGGCQHKPRICDDHNPCTLDVCDEKGGADACVHVLDPKACDDGDLCTKDVCNPAGGCSWVAETCDDGDPQTEDGCNPDTGCYYNPVECKLASECLNPDPCIEMQCVFGKCVEAPIVCNDNVACTLDKCVGGQCQFISTCTGSNACAEAVCNILTGQCQMQDIYVPDGNACTMDTCSPATGWSYDKIPGCCQHHTECETGDGCIIPVCDLATNQCANIPKVVDDGIDCTIDTCLFGYIANDADDSLCTDPNAPFCVNYAGGCVQCGGDYDNCHDGDPCTNNFCDYHDTWTCSSEPKCSEPKVCTPEPYEDGEITEDSYAPCMLPEGYCEYDVDCWQDECSVGTCGEDNFCTFAPKSCDDDNPCTVDTCDPEGPFGGGCVSDWKECEDGNECTYDQCDKDTGECTHEASAFCVPCETTEDCDAVKGTTCIENAVVTYSGVCNFGECHHDWVDTCQDDSCHIGVCKDGACTKEWKCDDGNACTTDDCQYSTGCTYQDVPCEDFNPCTLDWCAQELGCENDWDYEGCPLGPQNDFCGDLWNCMPCVNIENGAAECDDGLDFTLDKCIPIAASPSWGVCAHQIDDEDYTGGTGFMNFWSFEIQFNFKPGFYPWEQQKLDVEEIYYNMSVEQVEIFDVINGETYDAMDFPPGIACIDQTGTLRVPTTVEESLMCYFTSSPSVP